MEGNQPGMKRRRILQSAAVLPVLAAVPAAAQTASQSQSKDSSQSQKASAEAKALPSPEFLTSVSQPDTVGDATPQFLTADQFKALQKLGEIIVPAYNDLPGALEAEAAEFLANYISQSNDTRRKLYVNGLDALNAKARQSHAKAFAELTAEQAAPILQPLREQWTYNGPGDPLSAFLVSVKEDLLLATFNSHPYTEARSALTRSGSGSGYYWLDAD